MDIILVFIPDNFDIRKYAHLVGEGFLSRMLKINKDITRDGYFEVIKEDCDHLIKTGYLPTSFNYFSDIKDILTALDLIIDIDKDVAYEDLIMININAEKLKPNIKRIASGGWGIKHGGWGIESKS